MIRRIAAEEVQACAALASRAFWLDPSSTFIFRGDVRRRTLLADLMAGLVRYGVRYAEADTNEGEPRGLALWLPPPGRPTLNYNRMSDAGMMRGMFRFRPGEIVRSMALEILVESLFRAMRGIHHRYLWLLAVDPEMQGQGLGGALVNEGVLRGDAEGLPCVLETMAERNVRFYEKRGFRTVRHGRCALRGPEVWLMRRDVRAG